MIHEVAQQPKRFRMQAESLALRATDTRWSDPVETGRKVVVLLRASLDLRSGKILEFLWDFFETFRNFLVSLIA